jgi:hypothetical protein
MWSRSQSPRIHVASGGALDEGDSEGVRAVLLAIAKRLA